jgi:plastocyanin
VKLALALLAAISVAPLPASAGSVTGRVVFRREAPALPPVEVTKDQEACGDRVPSEALVVSPRSRGVRFAVVSVEGVPAPPATGEPGEVTLENRRCRFVPHVVALRAGSELAIVNADPVLHNLRAWGDAHRAIFNVVQPTQGQVTRRTIKKAGAAALTCDAHPHMSGYLVAFDHPYFAVTDEDGAFTIRDVPAGRYRLRVWHEGWTVVRRDEHGRSVHEPPRIREQDLVVGPAGATGLTVDLSEPP